ncbi:Protein 21.1 [Giardia duodenalis assemblage B]|uniref:Protein 21.1 n=1 Tax=Giardia duodenalis assemblage B TaxID=1394984 RepID=A0A132NPC4_GIAIN|nr:Protein 21.1 [Giardia intestinalis assemblage B]
MRSYHPQMDSWFDAVVGRNYEFVRENVKNMAGISNFMGTTGLCKAAAAGDLEMVKILFESEKDMVDSRGKTALMYAAENGHTSVISFLMPYMVKKQTNDKTTALMYAVWKGHKDAVSLLLKEEQGLTQYRGMTALMQAARYKHTDLCELLLSECGRQDNCGFTALLFATMSGCIDFVKKLWDKEGSITGLNGETPLMTAARENKVELIDFFISKGQAGKRDTEGKTALMSAAERGHIQSISALLKYEKNMQDNRGMTALMYASSHSKLEAAKILKDEIPLRDKNGRTALQYANLQDEDITTTTLKPENKDLAVQHAQEISPLSIFLFNESLQHTFIPTSRTFRSITDFLFRNFQTYKEEYQGYDEIVDFCDRLLDVVTSFMVDFITPFYYTSLTLGIAVAKEKQDTDFANSANRMMDTLFQEIEEFLNDDSDSLICCICLDKLRNVILYPCKHVVVCTDCLETLKDTCPYCRTTITGKDIIDYFD